ncbi:MAG: hypothetical protein WD009_05240 [Phycisphaeraceae bacterium]
MANRISELETERPLLDTSPERFDQEAMQKMRDTGYGGWLQWRLKLAGRFGHVAVADLKAQADRLGWDWGTIEKEAEEMRMDIYDTPPFATFTLWDE